MRHAHYVNPFRHLLVNDRQESATGTNTRSSGFSLATRDAEHIRNILNAGVDGNWGFVPVGREEMAAVVRDLKPILDPEAVWFVEDDGVPVGCCLGFPDINVILKETDGRLFPTGALRLLFGARRLRDYRLWGLDVLLYLRLAAALAPRKVRLEDNLRMRNALEKLGMARIKTYRMYEKGI